LAAGVLYEQRFMAGWGKLDGGRNGGRCKAGAATRLTTIAALLVGCGGAAPLLHPAHVLPLNTVSAGAGVSSLFASDQLERRIDHGRSAAGQSLSEPAVARTYATGVLTHALIAPGTSPWVGARVGLPYESEAGLTYTGRSVRLDGRHVIPIGDDLAFSVGLGATALLPSTDSTSLLADNAPAAPAAEFQLDAGGWGADLPVLIGYQRQDGFFDAWGGVRAGLERISGKLRLVDADVTSPRIDVEGHRWWAGAVLGFSAGVPPLWLRFELATTFHELGGKLTPEAPMSGIAFDDFEAAGWTLSPSGAIVGKF
jgi:hypothetical protein